MNLKKILTYIFFVVTITLGCNDMFEKTIDIDIADSTPKLSVTATLDTDSGRFALYVLEYRSMASFKNWHPAIEPIVKDGAVRLYEDDRLILSIQGPFDLSFRTVSPVGYNGYRYKTTGLSLKAGSMYRLEIDMEGYSPVWSTTTMPNAPIIEATLDTTCTTYKSSVINITNEYTASGYYHPIELALTDKSNTTEYYYFEQKSYRHEECNQDYQYNVAFNINRYLGIDDFALIQDNPDYQAKSNDLENGVYDLYEFNHLLLSNQSFLNSSINFQLYVPSWMKANYQPMPLLDYDPDTDGPEMHLTDRHDLIVRHITEETFRHYRNMIIQNVGIDFFTEPINIPGNIKNGLGCFSASNTKRFKLLEVESYDYPERNR